MKAILIFILVMALSYSVGQWLTENNMESDNIEQTINYSTCNPAKQTCEVNGVAPYSLQFNGAPSALAPFVVLIKVSDLQPESIELSFDMEGMDMGYNKYRLVNNGIDWKAKVILPVCSLGRNDWILNVKLEFENENRVTKFKFSQPEK